MLPGGNWYDNMFGRLARNFLVFFNSSSCFVSLSTHPFFITNLAWCTKTRLLKCLDEYFTCKLCTRMCRNIKTSFSKPLSAIFTLLRYTRQMPIVIFYCKPVWWFMNLLKKFTSLRGRIRYLQTQMDNLSDVLHQEQTRYGIEYLYLNSTWRCLQNLFLILGTIK